MNFVSPYIYSFLISPIRLPLGLILLLLFALLLLFVLRKIGLGHLPSNSEKNKNKQDLLKLIEEYKTDMVLLREKIKKLAQAERETAWREMAKLVAHEIKNPLTPLKLGVQLLQKSWETKDPEFEQKFERFTQSFIEQIESLDHLASEFSDFAKMPETAFEKLNLKIILEQAVELYHQPGLVKITFQHLENRELSIMGDKDQLSRSFSNLIKNAIEAIPKGKMGEINIRLNSDNNWAYLELSDNGIGIPENLKEQLFVPNFTTKSSGSGLGLAFVRQCLINMGGSIRFETGAEGTIFYIKIPLYSTPGLS